MNLVLPNVTEEQKASLLSQLSGIVAPPPGPVVEPPAPAPGPPPIIVPSDGKLIRIDLKWAPGTVVRTSDHGHCGPYDVVTCRFVTGNTPSDPNNLPWVKTAEYVDPLYERVACISDIEGSFDAVPGMLSTVHGTSVSIPFSVETPLREDLKGLYPVLARNTPYFFTFKVARPGEVAGTADVRIDIATGEH